MIHSTLEESLACTCPNCGGDHHAKFFSMFVGDMHYVIGDCESCGYRIEIRKDELGTGLFMPSGEISTVKETFKKEHIEHARDEAIEGSIPSSFSKMRFRFLDNESITEERER